MKPLRLTLVGLRSFRDEVSIDFEWLAGQGLFGIVGPTGAGKSTVIDALFLALYGDVPRGNSATDFVHPDAPLAIVDLTFAVTRSGETSRYRVRREWRRVKKRGSSGLSDEVSTPRVELHQQVNETEALLASGARDVERLISEQVVGIPMHDFRRAIVLPQGEFDRLLRAMPKDRAQLLGRVFGLARLGTPLQKQASAWRQKLDTDLRTTQARLGARQAQVASLEQLQVELRAATAARDTAREALTTAETSVERVRRGRSIAVAWQKAKQEWESAASLERDAAAWQRTLDEANRAERALPFVESFETARHREKEAVDKRARKAAEHASLQTEEARRSAERNQAATALSENEPVWLQQLENATRAAWHLTEAARLDRLARTADERCQTAQQQLAAFEERRRARSEQREKVSSALKQIEEQLTRERVTETERERVATALQRAEADAVVQAKTAVVRRVQETLAEDQASLQAALARFEEARQRVANAADPEVTEHLLHTRRAALESARALTKQVAEATAAEKAALQRFEDASELFENLSAQHTKLTTRHAEATADVADAVAAQVAAERVRASASRVAQAAQLAQSLAEGQPCPVCGSREHPLPAQAQEDLQAIEANAKAIDKLLSKARAEASTLSEQLARVQVKLEQAEAQQHGRTQEHTMAVQRLAELRAALGDTTPAALEAEVAALQERYKAELAARNQAQQRLMEAQSAREIAAARVSHSETAVRDAETEQAAARTALDALGGNAEGLTVDAARALQAALTARTKRCIELEAKQAEFKRVMTRLDTDALEEERSEGPLREQHKQAAAERDRDAASAADHRAKSAQLSPDAEGTLRTVGEVLKAAREAAASTQVAWATAHRNLEAARAVLLELDAQAAAAADQLTRAEAGCTEALLETAFSDAEAARAARLPPTERQRLATQLQQASTRVASARAAWERAEEEARTFDEPLPTEQALSLAERAWFNAKADFEEALQKVSSLGEQVRQAEAASVESSKLQATLAELAPRCARAEQIEKLLRGDALVAFAADRHLSRILSAATANLRLLSSNRYELVRADSGDFAVRDRYQANALRLATTLSGGESFLVSLALALALSEHIQQQGSLRFDFFFLDEGFGSLDEETLQTALDALERLRGLQRTIGTISHLPALLERLPRRLIVQKAPVGGTAAVRLEGES